MPEEVQDKDQNDEEDIVVTVEEDSNEEATQASAEESSSEKPTKESDDELENYTEGVQKRIGKLTAKMREAERREQAALVYAQAVQKQLEEANHRSSSLDTSYVNEFENRVKSENELLRETLKRAIDRGDIDAQIEAQQRIATLAGQQERLAYVKQEQERRKAQPAPQQQPYQPPKQAKPDARAEDWASRNDWFGSNEPMTLTAMYLHKQLTEVEGFDPTSDDYYAEIDNRMRTEFPHKFQAAKPKATEDQKWPLRAEGVGMVMVVGKSNYLRLKLQFQKKLGITEQQYAKQLLRMQNP
jgi:hypothetical protein